MRVAYEKLFDATSMGASAVSSEIDMQHLYMAVVQHKVSGTASNAYETTEITCVADSSGSLNNKYFLIYTAEDAIGYYVWFNVNGAGVDPAVSGKTGVAVALATDATATDVAHGVATELDGLAGFGATHVNEVVTVVNAAYGVTTDASNSAVATSPGFTYSVTTQGAKKTVGSITIEGSVNGSEWNVLTTTAVDLSSTTLQAVQAYADFAYQKLRVQWTRTSGVGSLTSEVFAKGF